MDEGPTLRMIHILGGPDRVVPYTWNGTHLMIHWPLCGWIEVVKTSGVLSYDRKGPWRVHPEDLGKITKPYREQAREAMRKAMRKVKP